jgi:hypothetical protein
MLQFFTRYIFTGLQGSTLSNPPGDRRRGGLEPQGRGKLNESAEVRKTRCRGRQLMLKRRSNTNERRTFVLLMRIANQNRVRAVLLCRLRRERGPACLAKCFAFRRDIPVALSNSRKNYDNFCLKLE